MQPTSGSARWLPRRCTVCGNRIRIMAFLGDRTCSDDCAKRLVATEGTP